MRAGTLKHRVELQSPNTAPDSAGWVGDDWTTVETVWSRIEPLSGREQMLAAQRQAETTHRITLRYSSEIAALDSSWRVLYGSRAFVIDEVRNMGEGDRMFELICVERPGE